MLVLEKIQDEYTDLGDFENILTGFQPSKDENGDLKRNEKGHLIGTYGVPDIKVVNKALCWMVQEGLEIEAEENTEPINFAWIVFMGMRIGYTEKEIAHMYLGKWSDLYEEFKKMHNITMKQQIFEEKKVESLINL